MDTMQYLDENDNWVDCSDAHAAYRLKAGYQVREKPQFIGYDFSLGGRDAYDSEVLRIIDPFDY